MTKDELKEKQSKSGKAHYDNIAPHTFGIIDPKKHSEISKKGHAAMVEKQRRKKDIKTICNELLSISAADLAAGVINPQIAELIERNGLDVTLYDLIIAKQAEQALKGSTGAAQFIRDTAGDKPTDKLQTDVEILTDADRELLNRLNDRLQSADAVTITTPL